MKKITNEVISFTTLRLGCGGVGGNTFSFGPNTVRKLNEGNNNENTNLRGRSMKSI